MAPRLGFLWNSTASSSPDAVEELAQMLGLEIPRDERAEKRAPVTPIYDCAYPRPRSIYRKALKQHPAAIEYLKARGLDAETVRRFSIGYAPGGWDYLRRQFGDEDKVQRQLMAAGLVAERDRWRLLRSLPGPHRVPDSRQPWPRSSASVVD